MMYTYPVNSNLGVRIMVYHFESDAEGYSHENAKTLCFLSKVAYLNLSEFQEQVADFHFDEIHCISRDQATAYVVSKENSIITIFRGSEGNHLDWRRNIRAITCNRGPGKYGSVHEGFQKVTSRLWYTKFQSASIQELMQSLQRENPKYWFTGHSQGGAAASLCAAYLQFESCLPVQGIYVFGSPRFAKQKYQIKFNQKLFNKTYRFENNNDLVVTVPPQRFFSFHHVGNRIYISSAGELSFNPNIQYVEADKDIGKRLAKQAEQAGPDCIEDHAINKYLEAITNSSGLQ